jgi:hypothetical protein
MCGLILIKILRPKTGFQLILCGALLAAQPLYADMIIPAIYGTYPEMLFLGLIPVILIEMLIMWKYLKTSLSDIFYAVSIANFISTIIGIPFSWILLGLFENSLGNEQVGYSRRPSLLDDITTLIWQKESWYSFFNNVSWIAPLAAMLMVLPFYLASCIIEYFIVKRSLSSSEIKPIKLLKGVLLANLGSYAVFTIIALFFILNSINKYDRIFH